ncbi:uncharacterized protein RHO25_003474 [Cercospora beticola]|uniref:F-box domain-containing protein n=1 Tax=Cercospora beticola TaxID=122368 RepID=A0ABZ0NH63_CERBT|nr:hypothetical protein RHO25_003474 [Cercospora beticola]CAK1360150.1 unnamed protein product [Cercospora beticola]
MAAVNHQASDRERVANDTETEMNVTTMINSTSTTTMGIAAQKVFDTPELLEQILLNLDSIGLHVLQRVSACFKDTMSASPKLRQHMFLQMRQEGLCEAVEQLLLEPRVRGKLGPLEFMGVRIVMSYTDSRLIIELDVSEDWFKAQAKLCTSGWWVPAECTAWKGRVAGLSWNKLRVTAKEVGVQVTLHCGHLEKSDCLHIEEPTLHDLLQHAWRLFLKMNDEVDLLHRTIMW